MGTVPKFRIDVNVHSLLMNSQAEGPELPGDKGMSLPACSGLVRFKKKEHHDAARAAVAD